MLEIDVDLSAAIEGLEQVKEQAGQAVKYAALRGARRVRDEAERLAPKSKEAHWFYSTASGGFEPHIFKTGKNKGRTGSKYLFYPGDLKRSVYAAEVKEETVEGEKAVYRVSFRKLSTSKGYVPYARWVEFGVGSRIPARPFLRPAWDTKKDAAEKLIVDTIKKAIYGT